MKVRTRQSLGPINLEQGDTFILLVDDQEVARAEVQESTVVDTAIIADLSKSESAALGLESGIVGIFGRA